jgi:hypothetical protein
MRRAGMLAVCVMTAGLWQPSTAAAQTEPRVLMLDDFIAQARYFSGVVSALGRRPDRYTESFVSFMQYFREEEWDYVVFIWNRLQSHEEHVELAELLERHISRGGTLAITYPNLDDAPELWEVLGVASAEDPAEPEDVFPRGPRHPMWLGSGGAGTLNPPLWSDFGDVLEPAPGSRVIGTFEPSGRPAMLESRAGHVLVNGVDWDDYGPASSIGRAQTMFLTTCIADFDGNGVLDFFDFLAYQEAFVAGDPRADLDGGGRLTFFDFLAFQDVFAYGCPRGQ